MPENKVKVIKTLSGCQQDETNMFDTTHCFDCKLEFDKICFPTPELTLKMKSRSPR